MPIDILMPQLSPTMTEGRLANWTKKKGDKVSAGDVIAEVETDKATMEVEATEDGVLHDIIGKPGEDIQVGTPIAVMAAEGEEVAKGYKPESKVVAVETAETDAPSSKEQKAGTATPQANGTVFANPAPQAVANTDIAPKGRTKASPLAKRLAGEAGINLSGIVGTGPHGRVIKEDIERARTGAQQPVRAGDEMVKHTPMRKSIATRLTASKQHVPHFYLTCDVFMDALMGARKQLNENAPVEEEKPLYKLSVNDMVIKACAMALKKNPDANAGWNDDGLVRFGNIDVAVAVAIEGGLITPVVKNADQKSLPQISMEIKDLAARAREGKLQPEEYEGGSFSLSNLGMYGVKQFQAIINPPQAAILAVGGTEERVVPDNGQFKVANVMSISLSVDHRVIDGALGAELLADIKNYLENSITMVV